jgi:hypothetical protein
MLVNNFINSFFFSISKIMLIVPKPPLKVLPVTLPLLQELVIKVPLDNYNEIK